MTVLSEQKLQARTTWATGDYPYVAGYIGEMGATTVERVGIRPGERVLDIGCGAGNATIPAALAGGVVTGLDLTPELLEAGRRTAQEAGVEVTWVEGDAEDLPFDAESFDVVLSTVGIMFAPDHARAAAEAARVLRPGGRLGIASWTPDGSVGRFFATTARHLPAPPPGFRPPILWGTRDHVTGLFEGAGVDLRFEDHAIRFRYASPDDALGTLESKFGPMLVARRALEPEGRWGALHAELHEQFVGEFAAGGGDGYPGEFLLVLGEKTGG